MVIEFVIMLAIAIVCILIFGSADSKRTVLRTVGLDLSPSAYKSKKGSELQKKCCKALIDTIDSYKIRYSTELPFLGELDSDLCRTLERNEFQVPIKVNIYFYEFAEKVVSRRINDLTKSECKPLMTSEEYRKNGIKFYIQSLWETYQHPWPEDWLKKG